MQKIKYLIPGSRTRQTKRRAYSPFYSLVLLPGIFYFNGDAMEKPSFKRLISRLSWEERLKRYTEEKNKLSRSGVEITDDLLQSLVKKWNV